MVPALLLTVAVVQSGGLVTLELPAGRELVRWSLSRRVVGVFVAPDGALWLPSADSDETVVARPGQPTETVAGRLVPLFFREPDRLYAVFPGELVALSYPERVRIASWPLRHELAPSFAVCSDDGRVVAVLAVAPKVQVVLLFPFDQGQTVTLPLAGFPDPQRLALSDGFLAVGGEGRVGVWPVGATEGVLTDVPGKVVDVAWAPDGRQLFLLLAAPESQLWRWPLPKKASAFSKPKLLWRGHGVPKALKVSEAGLVVLEADSVRLLSFRGRELAHAGVGGLAMGIMPSRPVSGLVPWSDSQP